MLEIFGCQETYRFRVLAHRPQGRTSCTVETSGRYCLKFNIPNNGTKLSARFLMGGSDKANKSPTMFLPKMFNGICKETDKLMKGIL